MKRKRKIKLQCLYFYDSESLLKLVLMCPAGIKILEYDITKSLRFIYPFVSIEPCLGKKSMSRKNRWNNYFGCSFGSIYAKMKIAKLQKLRRSWFKSVVNRPKFDNDIHQSYCCIMHSI